MGAFRLHFLLLVAVFMSGLVAMFPVAWIGTRDLDSSYREYVRRDMLETARLFAMIAAAHPDCKPKVEDGFDVLVTRAEAMTHVRFTLVGRDGSVLTESADITGQMENHADRPEIAAALAGREGVDIRQSATLGDRWLYAAVPMRDGLVARVAAPLEELNVRLDTWWRRILSGLAVSLVVLLLAAFLVARFLSRPLEAATAAAERYAGGELDYRPVAAGSAETRKLTAALGQMAAELDARFKLIVRQRERMRAVFENMSEGVLAVDAGGRVLLLNRAAEGMLGVGGDVSGEAAESVVRHPEVLGAVRECLSTGSPAEREARVDGGDGEILLQVHVVRMRHKEGGDGALAVLRDVTRLRRLENMRRDFVANVSHELRTPVTSIQSCLETLLEDGLVRGGERRTFLEMALRNTKRMVAVIGNLLTLAGIESGGSREAVLAAASPVGLVVDEALSVCAHLAEAKGVRFETDCADGTTAAINAPLLMHAVVNLVDNAIKYGPEGGVVRIRAGREGDKVTLSIADDGPGIPPEHRERVFERFYRVDGTARRKEGAGLGLALVKHIILSQGGDIRLECPDGGGCVFTLSLPD